MILVDTSIIVDYWHKPDKHTEHVIGTEDVCICGIIKAELVHGAKSHSDVPKIKEALQVFEYLEINEQVWERLGNLLMTLRNKGLSVPFQDAAIAAVALEYGLELWTNDKHYKMIAGVVPELILFQP